MPISVTRLLSAALFLGITVSATLLGVWFGEQRGAKSMNLEGRLGKSFAELPATSGCPRCPERDGGRPEGPFYEINALFQNGSEAAVSSVDGGSWEPRLPPQVHQPQLQRFHQSNPGAAGHYDNSTSTRKVCVQAWLYRTFGYDHIADFFVPGCDTPALWDFDRWAAVSGCGYHNDRSVHVGPLQIHTAWIGPVDGIFTELIALVDSFLATQHTVGGRAILTLWFLEDDPPSLDHPLRRRFVLHDGHAVRFERADLAALAAGTCLEGRREYLDVNVSGVDWKRAGTMGPKEKADMARILLLHAHGGVWVDTDSVLLRDLEPLVRFIGPDFATKITLSPLYNNNVLALRRRGDVARRMLEFVCETPFTPAGRRAYCSVVGTPCYPKWYWNHGVIQMAVRNGVSLVVVPWSYTDPAYPCFPQMLFSAAGAKPAPNLVIEDSLEMIRGAFVLHTRGYNAKKPLSNHSGFAKLYALAARRAASRPAPRGGPGSHLYRALGPRDVAEEAHFRRLLAPRGPNVVEPTFLPWHGPNSTYSIETARFPRMCLAASRARSIGDHPVVAVADCTTARSSDQETRHWRFQGATTRFDPANGDTGYLRPYLTRDLGGGMWGRILCVSGLPWHSKDEWSGETTLSTCSPDSPSQRWIIDRTTNQIRNAGLVGMCLQAIDRPLLLDGRSSQAAVTRTCHLKHSVGKSQRWYLRPA